MKCSDSDLYLDSGGNRRLRSCCETATHVLIEPGMVYLERCGRHAKEDAAAGGNIVRLGKDERRFLRRQAAVSLAVSSLRADGHQAIPL